MVTILSKKMASSFSVCLFVCMFTYYFLFAKKLYSATGEYPLHVVATFSIMKGTCHFKVFIHSWNCSLITGTEVHSFRITIFYHVNIPKGICFLMVRWIPKNTTPTLSFGT